MESISMEHLLWIDLCWNDMKKLGVSERSMSLHRRLFRVRGRTVNLWKQAGETGGIPHLPRLFLVHPPSPFSNIPLSTPTRRISCLPSRRFSKYVPNELSPPLKAAMDHRRWIRHFCCADDNRDENWTVYDKNCTPPWSDDISVESWVLSSSVIAA